MAYDDTNVLSTLKMQGYLRNQNLDSDAMNFLNNFKFTDLISEDRYLEIGDKVRTYKELGEKIKEEPNADYSEQMQELAQDVLYETGKEISSINMRDFKTPNDLNGYMQESGVTSKNDLYVAIDYDDYSSSTDLVKVRVVGHDYSGAMGISSGAKMILTENGKIITTKGALYYK